MFIRDIMTSDVRSVRDDKKLLAARTIMDFHRIRHLPVVNVHGDLVGLLTRGSLVAAAASCLEHRVPRVERDRRLAHAQVTDVIVRDPITIAPDAHVYTAAHLMASRKIGCLPVVEDGRLVGIVSEIDLLRVLEAADRRGAAPDLLETA